MTNDHHSIENMSVYVWVHSMRLTRYSFSKILELEEELKVVGNNMKSLEVSEQEVKSILTMWIS